MIVIGLVGQNEKGVISGCGTKDENCLSIVWSVYGLEYRMVRCVSLQVVGGGSVSLRV